MAYLVKINEHESVAFPAHVSQEFIDCPVLIVRVPKMATYAYGMIEWRGRWIPMIDFNSLINPKVGAAPKKTPTYCLILAYRIGDKQVGYAAMGVTAMPEMCYVKNSDFCRLPDNSDIWSDIAVSCFVHKQRAVPIISTQKVFSQSHS